MPKTDNEIDTSANSVFRGPNTGGPVVSFADFLADTGTDDDDDDQSTKKLRKILQHQLRIILLRHRRILKNISFRLAQCTGDFFCINKLFSLSSLL